MSRQTKVTSVVLAVVMILLRLTASGALTVFAAAGDTDIGCYEYGYTSSPSFSLPSDSYSPQLYGENAQSIYHVSPDGSDDSGDGSADNPWATIGHAASQVTATTPPATDPPSSQAGSDDGVGSDAGEAGLD